MISKTKIKRRARNKTNPELAETINLCYKNKKWIEVAKMLSYPRSRQAALNLDQIDKESKEGDIVVVPGKVLSNGRMTKKIRLACFSISEQAREKAKEHKVEIVSIKQELKANPEAKAVKILQ